MYQYDEGSCASSNQTSCADTASTPSGGPALTYSAVSDTGATSGGQKTLAAAYVVSYSPGLGVTSQAGPNSAANNPSGSSCDNAAGAAENPCSPQHAMDNDGNSEFILLSFSNAVSLNAITLGYENSDSDLTVLAYTGAAGGQGLAGKSYSGLIAAGWSLIGNYTDVYDTTTTVGSLGSKSNTVGISTSTTSSYWLIGAYNSAFGTTIAGGTGSSLNGGNDYVKLLNVYASTGGSTGQGVPEPPTMLLSAVALLSVGFLRQRRLR